MRTMFEEKYRSKQSKMSAKIKTILPSESKHPRWLGWLEEYGIEVENE